MRWSVISPLRIVLLDDHPLIRDSLKIRLDLEADFKVQAVYSTSRGLLDGLSETAVDLVVLDYQLSEGEIDGLRLIQSVRRHYPAVKIVIFSSSEKAATVNISLRAENPRKPKSCCALFEWPLWTDFIWPLRWHSSWKSFRQRICHLQDQTLIAI